MHCRGHIYILVLSQELNTYIRQQNEWETMHEHHLDCLFTQKMQILPPLQEVFQKRRPCIRNNCTVRTQFDSQIKIIHYTIVLVQTWQPVYMEDAITVIIASTLHRAQEKRYMTCTSHSHGQ
jgi:hypothetical protein